MTFGNVLFIQIKMLGDILMLTPAIRAFKEKFPESKIDVAVQPPGEMLLRHNPNVNRVISLKTKHWYELIGQLGLICRLRNNDYDLAVDFLGNPRSAHYTFLSGAKRRIGYSDARFQYAFTDSYPRTHEYSAISKLRFLEPLGVDISNYRPEFYLDPEAKLPEEISSLAGIKLAAVSPVSLKDHKVWPVANFGKVINYIYDKYKLHSLVIVGPGERRYLDEIKTHIKVPYTPVQINDLSQLGLALKSCSIYIGNDNGPKHIAVAMGLPTVTVYSHLSDPVCWEYPDQNDHKYIGGMARSDCRPIGQITPEQVIAKIDDLLCNISGY